uniref:Uncharacterized protein n=1 Tax=Timema bartmani TaxID=61472 RepID=A0A7R9EY98_9NEOP|nr:unnamed protein product [Timema bartmani]
MQKESEKCIKDSEEQDEKKFAPRCCVCKLPIMPEAGQEETVRVVALDRSFHIACYKCEGTYTLTIKFNTSNNHCQSLRKSFGLKLFFHFFLPLFITGLLLLPDYIGIVEAVPNCDVIVCCYILLIRAVWG